MNDFWYEIIAITIVGLIIIEVVGIFCFCFSQTTIGKDIAQRNLEWKQKVENCLIDSNYRKDCGLILYKDKQIQENKRAQEIQSSIIFSGMFVGSSINKR